MKKYNFGAGPSILPPEVIKATADALINFDGTGLSLAEISHRTKNFQAVMDEAQALVKELLNVPEGYEVLFVGMTVQGNGASLDVQRAALVPESDLLIAASPNDEANILACMLARKLGCPNTIARIRSRAYLDGVQLYGADHAYLMVNGTTGAIHAMLLGTLSPGDVVLVPRNAHRSLIGGRDTKTPWFVC